jgi:predicted O-methyltransferase YrrM
METMLTAAAQEVMDRLYADDKRQRAAGLPSSERTRNIDYQSGRYLNLHLRMTRPRLSLEIGSSNGLSTIWLAAAAATFQGYIVGTEILTERAAQANDNLAAAKLADWATVRAGAAAESLADLTPESVNFVFIDAEKEDYSRHLECVLPLLAAGATIIADNVISHDCTAYQAYVRRLPGAESITLPLERGLELTCFPAAPVLR